MATETDKTPSPADAPGEPSEPFVPGPDSGLRNPPSAIERGLKEAADAMQEPRESPADEPTADKPR
jgi:hypothetical protein